MGAGSLRSPGKSSSLRAVSASPFLSYFCSSSAGTEQQNQQVAAPGPGFAMSDHDGANHTKPHTTSPPGSRKPPVASLGRSTARLGCCMEQVEFVRCETSSGPTAYPCPQPSHRLV